MAQDETQNPNEASPLESESGTAPAAAAAQPIAEEAAAAAQAEQPTPVEAPAEAAAEASAAEEPQEEEEEKVAYQVLETVALEGSVKQYKVSIAREVFNARTTDLYKELGATVTIEGFRRGKAPLRLLEIRYGKEVEEDAVKELAANVSAQIIESDKLQALGEPDLKDWTVGKDNPVELVLEIEVRPEVSIQGYEGLEVEVEDRQVSEEMVAGELERLRQSSAQFKTAPEGALFNPGDGAVVDYEVLDQNGARLERLCASGRFEPDLAAQSPRELAERLPGLAPGQTISAKIESIHHTRRGEERKSIDTHTLTLKEIKLRELPELDDEFAKDLGDFASLEALKERIRKDLQAQLDLRAREETVHSIYDRLLEANPFPAPRTIVAASTLSMVGGAARQLAAAGVSLQDFDEATQQRYLDSTRKDAERRVRIDLAVLSIAKEQNIQVAEEDLERAIERMAEREGRRPLAIRARLERERRLEALRSELLVDKVNDFLISKTRVKKVSGKILGPDGSPAQGSAASEPAGANAPAEPPS